MAEIKAFITSADQSVRFTPATFAEYNHSQEENFVKHEFILGNKLPLTQLYNQRLRQIREDKQHKTDFVIFMHADVWFDLKPIISHIVECNDKYDIMGFAGAKKIDARESPLSWFTGSRRMEDQRYGKIIHDNMSEEVNYFNYLNPGVRDTRVMTVDGLCLVLGLNAICENIWFDEQFEFDFYDFDFCLDAIINKHLKVGCLTDVIRHASVGLSIATDKYLKFEEKFRRKWDFPVVSPIVSQ